MDKSLNDLANPSCMYCGGVGVRHNGYFEYPCTCLQVKPTEITEVEYGTFDFQPKDIKPLPNKENEELKSLCLWALRRLHKTYKDFGYNEYEKITGEKAERL